MHLIQVSLLEKLRLWCDSNCSFKKTEELLKSILGRRVETLHDINGKAVSAFAINVSLRHFNNIKKFQ